MNKRIIPEKMRAIIQKSGVPQKDLAAAAGITPVTLSRWLLQKRVPRMAELTRLAKVLHVSVDDFMGEKAEDGDELTLEDWKDRALQAEAKLLLLEKREDEQDAAAPMTAEEYLDQLRRSMRFVFNFLSQDSDFQR